jgi:hypothetical protein
LAEIPLFSMCFCTPEPKGKRSANGAQMFL